jgi:CheY-like chemotaxis protein
LSSVNPELTPSGDSRWRPGPTVLVADDDADILCFMEINLRLEGFEVVTARDGPDALAKVTDVQPDLVVLDVLMPGIDGYTVCRGSVPMPAWPLSR